MCGTTTDAVEGLLHPVGDEAGSQEVMSNLADVMVQSIYGLPDEIQP